MKNEKKYNYWGWGVLFVAFALGLCAIQPAGEPAYANSGIRYGLYRTAITGHSTGGSDKLLALIRFEVEGFANGKNESGGGAEGIGKGGIGLGNSAKSSGNAGSEADGLDKRTDENNLDYDKLFHAVSVAESGGCTSNIAKRTNNCCSIMAWTKSGKRYVRVYPSVEANKAAFIALWKKHYKIFPTPALAKKYTGGDNAARWLATVKQHYYN